MIESFQWPGTVFYIAKTRQVDSVKRRIQIYRCLLQISIVCWLQDSNVIVRSRRMYCKVTDGMNFIQIPEFVVCLYCQTIPPFLCLARILPSDCHTAFFQWEVLALVLMFLKLYFLEIINPRKSFMGW